MVTHLRGHQASGRRDAAGGVAPVPSERRTRAGDALRGEGARVGADLLVLYLLGYEQKCLVPVPVAGNADRAPLPVQGTMARRAFAANAILDVDDDHGRRLWVARRH